VNSKIRLKKRGTKAPSSGSRARQSGRGALFDFDEFVIAFGDGLDHVAGGAVAALDDRVGDTAGIQRDAFDESSLPGIT